MYWLLLNEYCFIIDLFKLDHDQSLYFNNASDFTLIPAENGFHRGLSCRIYQIKYKNQFNALRILLTLKILLKLLTVDQS